MDLPVSRTKIVLPRRRPEWLSRPRLIDLFYELLEYKLILVSAPAGYGKTTLMVNVGHELDLPACWLALDELDQDLSRFYSYLIASLAERFPDLGARAQAELQGQTSLDPDRLATVLAGEIYDRAREHFLLVLDDYHLVERSDPVRAFISRFIQLADENLHVALLSRTLPSLPDLTLMVGRSQVGGLSFRELAFETAEIEAWIGQTYQEQISPELAASLFEQTEGWITGLLLSAQSHWQGMSDRLRVAQASGVDLSSYLMDQVFDQQPDIRRCFLMQTSLMEEFNPVLCQRVLGEPPPGATWQALTEEVFHNNLFIQPLGDGWLRYHHLFRDFLQAEFARRHPAEYRRIYCTLAEVYAEEKAWEKSREIFQRLGDQSAVAALIERASPTLAQTGRYQTLAAWLDALPHSLLGSRPGLLSLRGMVAVTLGETAQGMELLERAVGLAEGREPQKELADSLIRRGLANLNTGRYLQALEDARHSLEALGQVDAGSQADALRLSGLTLRRLGHSRDAVEKLEQARRLYLQLGDDSQAAAAQLELGTLYRAAGEYDRAAEAYTAALNYWQQTGGLVRMAVVLNNLGVLNHARGNYLEAASSFENAVQTALRCGSMQTEMLALASLGDLYADLQADQAALDAYRQARQGAQRLSDHFLLFHLDLGEALIFARLYGPAGGAAQLLETARRSLDRSRSDVEQASYLIARGQILLDNNPAEARQALQEAGLIFAASDLPAETARTELYLSIAEHLAGNPDSVEPHLIRMMDKFLSPIYRQPLIAAASRFRAALVRIEADRRPDLRLEELLAAIDEFETRLPGLRRSLRRQQLSIPFAAPHLKIEGLGASRVFVDGREITSSDWQTQRAHDLFFLLLDSPDGRSREKIETVFWPDAEPGRLKFNFKKTKYRVRRLFPEDPLEFDGERYHFNRRFDYEYDVEELERCAGLAYQAGSDSERRQALQAVVDLYKGEYLPEVEGTWPQQRRSALLRLYVEAGLELARFAAGQADYERVVTLCLKLLTHDRCLEEGHRLAMQAYAGLGNSVNVQRQFELCTTFLDHDLGLSPSDETVQLYRRLI